jgi:dihydropteroate synthase
MELKLGARPLIMGILNVTPDSFFDGGRYADPDKAVERALRMRDEGADIIDIGGESSRPGAMPVSAQEEMDRVCPVIERVSHDAGVPVSVDTYKSEVAEAALRAGASIVNDITALGFDDAMGGIAARYRAHVVLMHMKGTPRTMQDNPVYRDIVGDIAGFLRTRAEKAAACGIGKEKIILDPGIGFGKGPLDNYTILRNLGLFRDLGYPLLVGLSRKSLIKVLYDTDRDRLPATVALNAIAAYLGADIVRVHDVTEHRLAMAAVEMIKRAPVSDAGRN